ncbi:MAG: PTS sugar transporter subunit IIC [Pelolinea sp.]|jgi:PTS system cellobiose-specific IIC component|nr:PTS sugar transporter subunit IIC [Pelolinea sp.]
MKENKMDHFINKILPVVDKFQNNLYVSSIMEGMMSSMPVLMASAVLQLIYSFPITAWTNFLTKTGLYGLFGTVVTICNMTALFIVFGIGRVVGNKKGIDGLNSGLASLLCFLIITPLTVDEAGGTLINTSWFSAQGIFTAIIVALVASSIYAFCVKKNIVIKLPEAVPGFVAKSFAGIPAALITVIPFIAVRGLFAATSYGSFSQFIYSIVQTPLVGLGNSLPAHLVAILIACFLWWLGIHGTLVVLSVMMAVWQPPMIENITAAAAGLPIPNVLSFLSIFLVLQFMGGPGCLFGLYVDMALFSKSQRYKAQSKLSLVSGVFNIIEPTVYGLPIVLNPVLLIPYLGLPIVIYVAYYLLATAGIIGIPCVGLTMMVVPGPIAGFLLGGGVSLGIFTIAALILTCLVYYPFFKILDAQALKQESGQAKLAK